MATPSSPAAITFPGVVRSPSKEVNSHPYPIKTTSTAVLSRSNSLSSKTHDPLLYVTAASPNVKPLGRSQSRGHGRANSLSSIAPPPPLPLPAKRRDSQDSVQAESVPLTPKPEVIAQLPDNPKHWTPGQLSIYLSSALRFKGGAAIPAPVAKDIAAFTLREKLTGRAFLRLGDDNLIAMGVNQLWREALLAASRTLRKKVLKGRIWGFGSQQEAEDDDSTPVKGSKQRIPSTVEEESPPPSVSPSLGFRRGRVRGIVESLERSNGSNTSDGSDEVVTESQISSDARIEKELRDAGLWISDTEGDDDLAGNLSASSSSDNEMTEEYHSRNSSLGSQPPAYTRNGPDDSTQEPTIAELLTQDASLGSFERRHPRDATYEEAPSWGAMVWEKDPDILGGTAKKILRTPVANAARPIKPGVINGAPQPNIHNIFGDVPATKELEAQPLQDNTRELLDSFRVRLEAMENRLKELELRDEEREKELLALKKKEKPIAEAQNVSQPTIDLSPDPDPYASIVDEDDDPVDIPWPRPVRQLVKGSAEAISLTIAEQGDKASSNDALAVVKPEARETSTPEDMVDPTPSEFSDLPAYVLLVTMGVATVVARILFRKMGGGRRP